MFEGVREIPRAMVSHPADDKQAYARAAAWLLRQGSELGGAPLLYVPGKDNYRDEPVLVALAQQVTTATWRTLLRTSWSGGPVLAAWPSDDKLAEIDGDRRTTALCVLTWSPQDVQAWASAHQPEQLSPGAPTPDPAGLADPVVECGMQTSRASSTMRTSSPVRWIGAMRSTCC